MAYNNKGENNMEYINKELEWTDKEIRKRLKDNTKLMTAFKDLMDDEILCHDCRIGKMKEINIKIGVNNEIIKELNKLREELKS